MKSYLLDIQKYINTENNAKLFVSFSFDCESFIQIHTKNTKLNKKTQNVNKF